MATAEIEVDTLTQAWIRNESDEKAAHNGCRFDLGRGLYTVWWIERYCRLYQGEQAGERMMFRTCGECDHEADFEVPDEWDDEAFELYRDRAEKHNACYHAGHHIDWQFECTVRAFGWVKYSIHWKREVRRFRKVSIWVSKKNKKSPTLAGWGLYLECGDGEPGQCVYLGAKDGMQARDIGAKHAMEMVRQSPELSESCTLNLSRCSVTHEITRSVMIPLSSSNVRTKEAKEGLNGSVIIDETHVVDREFISIINRAGISRSEPIHAEFSTAGDNPDGYGKEIFDHASEVVCGKVEDEQLFVAIYAAPQDLKDSDLALDPLKYGRMANPALGHTVDPQEFLNDYNSSKVNPREFVKFKKYRLNIWQFSTNPWLRHEWWKSGQREYTAEDLRGRKCWSALDLSSVRDFTSLCLGFPDPNEEIKHLWYYWIPEETADEISDRIPIDAWLADPRVNLILIPGARVEYGFVRSSFREICSQFQVQELAYDDWNAEKVTQEISEGVRDLNGKMTEPPMGVKRVAFDQSLKNMNEPTKSYEGRTIAGKTLHNGDPLTEWMHGNAQVRNDANNNYKPQKPPRESLKKIDGVITGIMVDARIVQGGHAANSVYETRGIRTL